MSRTLQFKRGNKSALPILAQGEPGWVTDENSLYIGTGSENIKIAKEADIAGKAGKSSTVTGTLSASSWTGEAAPYSYTLNLAGITATSNQEILPALNISAEELSALQGANIVDGGQAAGSITLLAFGDKPTIDIPIRIVLRGD